MGCSGTRGQIGIGTLHVWPLMEEPISLASSRLASAGLRAFARLPLLNNGWYGQRDQGLSKLNFSISPTAIACNPAIFVGLADQTE